MAKVTKYLKGFSTTIAFICVPMFALQNFFWKEAPNAWEYGFAIVAPLVFVFILVNDIIAFRKGIKH